MEKRRSSLEKNLDARNQAKGLAKETPSSGSRDLQYPLYDQLDNYIIFRTRAREAREGANAANLLSKEDIEIAGFLIATIAWGNRTSIIKNSNKMMQLMDDSPYDFIKNHSSEDLKVFDGFVHRTFNSDDWTEEERKKFGLEMRGEK